MNNMNNLTGIQLEQILKVDQKTSTITVKEWHTQTDNHHSTIPHACPALQANNV